MKSLDETVARILEARRRRNVFREDPYLTYEDRAYRAGKLRSAREWPGFVGVTRRGRALPPSRNDVEDAMLARIFGGYL